MLPKPTKQYKYLYDYGRLISTISRYMLIKKSDAKDVETKAEPSEQASAKIAEIKQEIQSRREALVNTQVYKYVTEELKNFFSYLRYTATCRARRFLKPLKYHKPSQVSPRIALAYPMDTYIGSQVFAYEAKNEKNADTSAFYYVNTTGLMIPTTTAVTKSEPKTPSCYQSGITHVDREFQPSYIEKFKPINYDKVIAGPDDTLIIMISDKNPLFTPEALLRVFVWAYAHFNYVIIIPTGTLQVHTITLERMLAELDQEQKRRIEAVLSAKPLVEQKEQNSHNKVTKDEEEALRKEQQAVGKAIEMAKCAGFTIYCDSTDKLLSAPNLKKLHQVNTRFDKLIADLEREKLSDLAALIRNAKENFTLNKSLREVLPENLKSCFDALDKLILAYTPAFLKRITIRQAAKVPKYQFYQNVMAPLDRRYFSEMLYSPEPGKKVALIIPWQVIKQKFEYVSIESMNAYVKPVSKQSGNGYGAIRLFACDALDARPVLHDRESKSDRQITTMPSIIKAPVNGGQKKT